MKKVNPLVHHFFYIFVVLMCFKLLHIIYLVNRDLFDQPPVLFFTHQNIYKQLEPLGPKEDCMTPIPGAEYRYRVADVITQKCRRVDKQPGHMPKHTLDNIVIDRKNKFLYTKVTGSLGNKWTEQIHSMHELDASKSSLIQGGDILKSVIGRQYLSSKLGAFKFYFVRNPLDRVISGYYYYFFDLKYSRKFMDGLALKELALLNHLNPAKIRRVTFQQYIVWIINSKSAREHFGVQYNIIQPCYIKYTLNGIFEILDLDRTFVTKHVPDLKTPPKTFTTKRNVTYLTEEALSLTKTVNPTIMEQFYDKYKLDYEVWNYSKPGDWWYPYPGTLKHKREINPTLSGIHFPKVKDLSVEETEFLEGIILKSSTARTMVDKYLYIIGLLLHINIV